MVTLRVYRPRDDIVYSLYTLSGNHWAMQLKTGVVYYYIGSLVMRTTIIQLSKNN